MTVVMSRRSALAAGAALALGAAGCAPSGGSPAAPGTSQPSTGPAVLPEFRPLELVRPDLPGTDLVMPGYFAYPRDPRPMFAEPPAAGLGSVSLMYNTFLPVPAGPASNSFWSLVQQDLGADLNLNLIPAEAYKAKFQAMVASGDLPDVMLLSLPIPDQPRMMASTFADLGPLLSGGAVAQFPALANIPTASWLWGVSNGTIQAIPQHRAVTGGAIFHRRDLLAAAGVSAEPANLDDLLALMAAVTDPGRQRWAFSNAQVMHTTVLGMLGGPNTWSESGGTFTSAYVDPRYREALDIVAGMVRKGYAHPTAATAPYAQHREYFYSGATALIGDGYAAWDLFVSRLGDASKLGLMVMPKKDGGGDGPQIAGTGVQGIAVINKKHTGEKLRKMVDVVNFLCAPIGSREHLRRKYGQEGLDHEWQDGRPVLTKHGQANQMDFQYIADAPTVLGPGREADVSAQHAWHTRVSKNLVRNPAIGLYSDTFSRKGATIARGVNDVLAGVLFGRNSLADFDAAVARWRSEGGDAMAAEYAESLDAQ